LQTAGAPSLGAVALDEKGHRLRSISDVECQQARPARLIAIFGSGETSATMTSVHKELTARVSNPRHRVRLEMRHLIIRLGDLARDGGREAVRESVAPLVDVLLSLRGEARREQRFNDADRIRAILSECGVEVQDTPSGTAWALAYA